MKFLAAIGTAASASLLVALIGILVRQDARGWPMTIISYTIATMMIMLLAGAVVAGALYIFTKD